MRATLVSKPNWAKLYDGCSNDPKKSTELLHAKFFFLFLLRMVSAYAFFFFSFFALVYGR